MGNWSNFCNLQLGCPDRVFGRIPQNLRHRVQKSDRLIPLTLVCLASFSSWGNPAVAHNIQTDGTVGATFHIEPDHNPRAGEPTTAWFALTQAGGEAIPLAQCDCRLAVYDRATEPDTPVLTPPLEAIAAEQYRDIPGAEIVFPQAGIYELEISGSPKAEADFEPFALTYSVTVSPGKAAATPAAVPAETAPTAIDDTVTPKESRSIERQWYWAAIGLGAVAVAVALWMSRQPRSK